MLKQGMVKRNWLVSILIFSFLFYDVVGVAELPTDITTTDYPFATSSFSVDPCNPNPCKNGGVCLPFDDGSIQCDCGISFTGVNCELSIESCTPGIDTVSGCLSHSECTVTSDGTALCVCMGNFKGQNCSTVDDLITCQNDLAVKYIPSNANPPTPVHCFKTLSADTEGSEACIDPDDPITYKISTDTITPGVSLLPVESEGLACLQVDFGDKDEICIDVVAFEDDDIILRPERNATVHVCMNVDHPPNIDPIREVTYNVADENSWKKSWDIIASDSNDDALTYAIDATVPEGYLQYFNVEPTSGKVTLASIPTIIDSLFVTLTVSVSQSDNRNQVVSTEADVHFYNFTITCSANDIIISLRNQPESTIGQIDCLSSLNETLTYTYDNPLSESENITVSEKGFLSLRSPLTDPGTHYVMVLVKGTLTIGNDIVLQESLVAQSQVSFDLIAGYFEPTCNGNSMQIFSENSIVDTCIDLFRCLPNTYGTTPSCSTTDRLELFKSHCNSVAESDTHEIVISVCSEADLIGKAGEYSMKMNVSNQYGATELTIKVTVMSYENSPPVFLNTPYETNVTEDTETDSIIFTNYYNDPDENDIVTIVDLNDDTFSVTMSEEKSFSLILTRKLNASLTKTYQLSLTIKDSANGSAQATVNVYVQDVNEPPICINTDGLLSLTLNDPKPTMTEIATVQCSDPDSKKDFSTLTYSLAGLETESFTINQTTGVLSVAADLMADPLSYNFIVIVVDGGGLDMTVDVTVTINYVCDLGKKSNTGRVPCTDCPLGQYQDEFGQRTCKACPSQQTTTSEGSTLELDCVDEHILTCETDIAVEIYENVTDCFPVDTGCSDSLDGNTAMNFSLTDNLDLFTVGDNEAGVNNLVLCPSVKLDPGSLTLNFEVATAYKTIFLMVVIEVLDVNDPPRFSEVSYEATIMETLPVGSSLSLVVKATDDGGVLQYSTDTDVFRISDGYLFLQTTLNATDVDVYKFLVTAEDESGLFTTVSVIIWVIDINEPPTCPGNIEVNLNLTTEVQTVLGRTGCIDTDKEEEYRTIVYDYNKQDAGPLDINEDGDIHVSAAVPKELISYVFPLRVLDKKMESALESGITVNVSVVVNTNFPPICSSTELSAEMQEDELVNIYCLTPAVTCSDPTGGVVTIKSEEGNGRNLMAVVNRTVDISNDLLLNLCLQNSASQQLGIYTVAVQLSNGLGETTVTWTFSVKDVNDPPEFTQSSYNISIPENSEVGKSILSISATDRDKTDVFAHFNIFAEILGDQFSEISFHEGCSCFKIDSLLNATSRSVYEFLLKVVDDGGLFDTASVLVTVTDVNESPGCDGIQLSLSTDILAEVGKSLGNLNCYDYDLEPQNKELSYTTSGNGAEYFEVTDVGEIILAKKLPRLSQKQTFMVTVSDHALDPRSTSVMVEVSVDNAFPAKCSPSFSYPDRWVIDSCLKLSLNCEDATMDGIEHLTHVLSGNYTEGFRRTSADNADPIELCYNLISNKTFVITVEVDNGLMKSEYTEYIVVEYLASTPSFDISVYIVSVLEGTPAGSEVVTVRATASSDGTIVYSILGSSSQQEYFSIDSQGTIKTLKSVAELVTETVVLEVEAMDDISKLKSTVNVEIKVTDTNEPPSCDIGDANITIDLVSDVGETVKMFSCSDPDVSSPNKKLVFSMGGNDVNSQYFEIKESGAVVEVQVRSLLPVDRSEFELLILVSDMGIPPQSRSYPIHVSVNLMPSAPSVTASPIDSYKVLVEWSYIRNEFLDLTTKFLLTLSTDDSVIRRMEIKSDQNSEIVANLSAETNYVISVAGEVGIGSSPAGTVAIRTPAVPKISKMLASMRFPDEVYITAFGDKDSSQFLEEKQKIIDNLIPLLERHSGFEIVEIISLRPGSVIADTVISINQNGNMSDIQISLQQTVSSGWIGDLTVDPDYFVTGAGDGYVSVIKLEGSDVTLLDGANVNFTCKADTIGRAGEVKMSWLWREVLVQPLSLDSRIIVTPPKLSDYQAVSFLTVNPVKKKDDGELECSVQSEDGTMVSSKKILVNVFLKPTVTLYPLSWSLEVGKYINFTCTADRDSIISWYIDGQIFSGSGDIELIHVSDKQEKLLIKKLVSMIEVSCTATVSEGTGPRVTATVGVFADGLDLNACPAETDHHNVLWDVSIRGLQNVKDCPNGLLGTVSRKCTSDNEWEGVDYDRCISPVMQQVKDVLDDIKDGLSNVSIENALENMADTTDTRELVTGELQKTAEILDDIAFIAKLKYKNIEDDIFGKFLEVVSNVIGDQNKDEWNVLLQQNKTGASAIMKATSEFSEDASTKFLGPDYSRIVSKKNIVVEFGKSKPKDLKFPDKEKKDFPSWVLSSLNRLSLDKQAIVSSLGSDIDVSFSSIFYRNLSSIVHSYQESELGAEESEDVTINSDILSLTLKPSLTRINPPLQLKFEHISTNFSNAKCSYWKFKVPNTPNGAWSTAGCSLKSSSDRVTICECEHLTNFAILMSPTVTPIVHTLTLSIISLVGCGISLLCLLMTISIHLFLWRYVKCDRIHILMNLCVALIIAYVLFIAGVNRTENEAVCTAIAAMLHYFYLVVFFLMLAQGIEVAITVLYVFSTKSRIKWMLPLAWALPAVIVAISLGVTELNGYGNSQFCWLSVDGALIFAFIGPALAVILINLVIICAAFRAMFRTSVMLTKSVKQQAKTGLRSLCILLPVMGLTWVFGVFSVNENLVFFQYLFAICNSLQGLFIFIFHCVLSRQVREGFAHKRRRKKSLADFTSRSTSRGSPIKSRDNESSVDLEKKVSPFLEADRQVHEMARKLKKSTDEHNLEDKRIIKEDGVLVISLDDVKISNLPMTAKSPLRPSISDNPSTQTTTTTNTTEQSEPSHLDVEQTERDHRLNDLDKSNMDYESYLEPNILPIQTHLPESPQHQRSKPHDRKAQRKPYVKWDSEKREERPKNIYHISEHVSPVQFRNPVYPMGRMDEINPARLPRSRIAGTMPVTDTRFITPSPEDLEELEMRRRNPHYRHVSEKPKNKLRESHERLQVVYSNSQDVFVPEIQRREPRREAKQEKVHKYSPRAARKKTQEPPKYADKSKQPPVAKKRKHGRKHERSEDYEYEFAYVQPANHASMEDLPSDYIGYHPYGGIRSAAQSRYPHSDRYDNQFSYPWSDQYAEYW